MKFSVRNEPAEMSFTFNESSGGGALPSTTFEVTPGREAQTVTPPPGYVFSGGVVAAIPSNYGLITHTGFALTVS